jgi:hypothetical protein
LAGRVRGVRGGGGPLQLPVVGGVLGSAGRVTVTRFDAADPGSLVVVGPGGRRGTSRPARHGTAGVARHRRRRLPCRLRGGLVRRHGTGSGPAPGHSENKETMMSDMVFVLLTVAVFVLLGLLVKGVERL